LARTVFVEWLMKPPDWYRKRRRRPRKRPRSLVVSHPGALTHHGAIVVRFQCRLPGCEIWVDRVPVGRVPRYCSDAHRQAAWRRRAA
jgi:hypothetical protein